MIASGYNFGGNSLNLYSSNKRLQKAFSNYWKVFHRNIPYSNPKIDIHINEHNQIAPAKKYTFFSSEQYVIMTNTDRTVVCNFGQFPWQIYITYYKKGKLDIFKTSHQNYLLFYILDPLLLNLLKRLNLILLHSSCVAKNNKGILLCGSGGSGKSSLAFEFIRKNANFISDDLALIKKINKKTYALGADNQIWITDKIISFYPKLNFLRKRPARKKGKQFKRVLEKQDLKKIYNTSRVKKTKIDYLFFPKVNLNKKTIFKKISKQKAMIKMMQQKPPEAKSLIKDKIALKNQFDTYQKLVQTTESYILNIGNDHHNLSLLIEDFIKQQKI